jgi:hypothetical protein
MSSKELLEELAHPEYWNDRYTTKAATGDKYDWLRSLQATKPFLKKHLPNSQVEPRILQLGYGNSVGEPLFSQLNQSRSFLAGTHYNALRSCIESR